jgi:hypothetical protein
MRQRVLLVEPAYKNKYPPLGLMKLASFHRDHEDDVYFVKGMNEQVADQSWDRIYVSTLFTFYWTQTVDTINYYKNHSKGHPQVLVGGVMATLMKADVEAATGATVIPGLLNKPGCLGLADDESVDTAIPDYDIIDPKKNALLTYDYPVADAYIGYATRGCIRHCPFCAVPTIEPDYESYVDLARQVRGIEKLYGKKRDLLLMDNNVLASRQFPRIVEEIKSLGFERGATLKRQINGRSMSIVRHVDFNQGIDSRLLNETNMELLSQLAIYPLRIAFDDVELMDVYCKQVRLAAKYGIPNLSNYVLFNYKDDPQSLYRRLLVNVDLNEEFAAKDLKTRVWSFPMRFCPVVGPESKDRRHIGPLWTAKQLRGVRSILAATHGVVGPKKDFFLRAFGRDVDEFLHILDMPEDFIVHRMLHERNGDTEWLQGLINGVSREERDRLQDMIASNKPRERLLTTSDPGLRVILDAYAHSEKPR